MLLDEPPEEKKKQVVDLARQLTEHLHTKIAGTHPELTPLLECIFVCAIWRDKVSRYVGLKESFSSFEKIVRNNLSESDRAAVIRHGFRLGWLLGKDGNGTPSEPKGMNMMAALQSLASVVETDVMKFTFRSVCSKEHHDEAVTKLTRTLECVPFEKALVATSVTKEPFHLFGDEDAKHSLDEQLKHSLEFRYGFSCEEILFGSRSSLNWLYLPQEFDPNSNWALVLWTEKREYKYLCDESHRRPIETMIKDLVVGTGANGVRTKRDADESFEKIVKWLRNAFEPPMWEKKRNELVAFEKAFNGSRDEALKACILAEISELREQSRAAQEVELPNFTGKLKAVST